MSLRVFHICFIVVSALLTGWLGFSVSAFFFPVSAGILVYLAWFVRKSGGFGKT